MRDCQTEPEMQFIYADRHSRRGRHGRCLCRRSTHCQPLCLCSTQFSGSRYHHCTYAAFVSAHYTHALPALIFHMSVAVVLLLPINLFISVVVTVVLAFQASLCLSTQRIFILVPSAAVGVIAAQLAALVHQQEDKPNKHACPPLSRQNTAV